MKNNLVGQKFQKLTVIKDSGLRASNGGVKWECLCECGNTCIVDGGNLKKGKQDCGKCKKRYEDLTNQKFNKLLVLEKTDKKVNEKIVWKCQCECGNITYVHSANLKSGAVKSCGCLANKITNLHIGDKFGKLTIIGHPKENYSLYLCKCECGEELLIQANRLVSGHIASCGNCNKNLLKNQIINGWQILEQLSDKKDNYYLYKVKCTTCNSISNKTLAELKILKGKYCSNCHSYNIVGNTYGLLTVISQKVEEHKGVCLCQCACGNQLIVKKYNLVSGNTYSCGCLIESKGEHKINEILQALNISFERQKTFETCRFKNTGALARFDFYLTEYNIIIEYDGQQHFKETNSYFKDNLLDIQQRDQYKNEWCDENNIKLIRIPYTEFNNINEEYIINLIN